MTAPLRSRCGVDDDPDPRRQVEVVGHRRPALGGVGEQLDPSQERRTGGHPRVRRRARAVDRADDPDAVVDLRCRTAAPAERRCRAHGGDARADGRRRPEIRTAARGEARPTSAPLHRSSVARGERLVERAPADGRCADRCACRSPPRDARVDRGLADRGGVLGQRVLAEPLLLRPHRLAVRARGSAASPPRPSASCS